MRGRGDPAFPGAAVVVAVALIVFAPLIALVARRRWRLAAARQAEVRRLLRLAAAEATRAEIEAALEYASANPLPVDFGAGGGADDARMLCAVCGSPTTTRCSRCKAVKYCSGRCQIIHWRRGHKDECHPPRIDDNSSGSVCINNMKGMGTEGSDLCGNSFDIGEKLHATAYIIDSDRPLSESSFSSEVFTDDGNHGVEPFIDASETDSTCDSSADSSSSFNCFMVSDPLKLSIEASASKDPHANVDEPSHNIVSPCSSKKEKNDSKANLTEVLPSESASVGLASNGASCTRKTKMSNYKPEDIGGRSSSPFGTSVASSMNADSFKEAGDCMGSVLDPSGVPNAGVVKITDSQFSEKSDYTGSSVGPRRHILFNSSSQGRTSQPVSTNGINSCIGSPTEVSSQLDLKKSTTLSFSKSGPVANERINDVSLSKPRDLSRQSSVSCTDRSSLDHEGHSVSHDTSSHVGNAPTGRAKFSDATGSANGISDITTSVRKVVHQFKSPPISKKYPSAFKSDICGKYKMPISYDLFIKLYNCEKVELHPFGLTNCGNSCYANAVLQCLAFTRPLTAFLLQGLHSKTCLKREWCFTCEFESLLMKAKGGHSVLSPIGILSHIRSIGSHLGYGSEEDAHEFLRCAIDAMQSVSLVEVGENAVRSLAEETSLVQLIFGGFLLSKIKCLRCRGKSERRERMMDLTVEIHGDIGTLEEALARFTSTEILDGENKYRCNRCKSYERAKKKLTVLEAPNVLTVALKRFQSGKFGKLNKQVRFPETLNLAPYMSGNDDKSPVYKLYAVVVHQDIMNAAFSGHYISYVKSAQKKWYKIDDSKVQTVEFDRVLSKNAYLLLYARCSPQAPSATRNSISQDLVKNKRSKCKDDVLSGNSEDGDVTRRRHSSVAQDRSHGVQSSDILIEPFRFTNTDCSSDSSSLLSCSDEGSWSTDSTRNSTTSTEEFSAYIFGESGRFSSNSPSAFSDDSDGHTYSPLGSRHASDAPSSGVWGAKFSSSCREDAGHRKGLSYDGWRPPESQLEGRGNPPFLYSNQSRKLTEGCRSRETDWVNPQDKSNLLRRCITSRERRDQTH